MNALEWAITRPLVTARRWPWTVFAAMTLVLVALVGELSIRTLTPLRNRGLTVSTTDDRRCMSDLSVLATSPRSIVGEPYVHVEHPGCARLVGFLVTPAPVRLEFELETLGEGRVMLDKQELVRAYGSSELAAGTAVRTLERGVHRVEIEVSHAGRGPRVRLSARPLVDGEAHAFAPLDDDRWFVAAHDAERALAGDVRLDRLGPSRALAMALLLFLVLLTASMAWARYESRTPFVPELALLLPLALWIALRVHHEGHTDEALAGEGLRWLQTYRRGLPIEAPRLDAVVMAAVTSFGSLRATPVFGAIAAGLGALLVHGALRRWIGVRASTIGIFVWALLITSTTSLAVRLGLDAITLAHHAVAFAAFSLTLFATSRRATAGEGVSAMIATTLAVFLSPLAAAVGAITGMLFVASPIGSAARARWGRDHGFAGGLAVPWAMLFALPIPFAIELFRGPRVTFDFDPLVLSDVESPRLAALMAWSLALAVLAVVFLVGRAARRSSASPAS